MDKYVDAVVVVGTVLQWMLEQDSVWGPATSEEREYSTYKGELFF